MEVNSWVYGQHTRTKAIETALAPISAQVAQLTVLNAAWDGARSQTTQAATLVENAGSVMASAEELAKVGQRIAMETNDQALMDGMPEACELLRVAGHNLVTATQRVHLNDFDRPSREHLVIIARSLLEATLKVLLLSDDAEVRRIVDAAGCVLQRLRLLTGVTTTKQLVQCFERLTDALSRLVQLCDRRQLELSCARRREALLVGMAMLRKCAPMLGSAMKTCVRFTSDTNAEASRDYVIGQLIESVDDIVNAVSAHDGDTTGDTWGAGDEPGCFVTTIDRIQYRLSEDGLRESFDGADFDSLLEGAVRHAMAVAQISDSTHRDLIVKNCQRLFRQKAAAARLASTASPRPHFCELRADAADAWRRLAADVGDLERRVGAATLRLAVGAFCETTEPAARLARGAGGMEDVTETQMAAVIAEFQTHADRMCQVARFVIAASTDTKRLRLLRACVTHLERLDPELVPAALAGRGRRPPTSSGDPRQRHLRLLMCEWTSNVEMAASVLDAVVDQPAFVRVSAQCVCEDVRACGATLRAGGGATAALRTLVGRGRRLAEVATAILEGQDHAVFRSGLRVFVNRLHKALRAVKRAGTAAIALPDDDRLALLYETRRHRVVSAVSALTDGLAGRGHPPLNSPARARPLADLARLNLDASSDDDGECKADGRTSGATTVGRPRPTSASADDDTERTATKQRTTMKMYINELTSDKMADFVQSLTSAAVAGQQQRIDLIGNDVLTLTNHITEMASMIASGSINANRKQTLESVSSDATSLVPQLLDVMRRVALTDATQVEPLYTMSDTWAKTVSFLERYIDGIVERWLSESSKLVDAVRLQDCRLAAAQTEHIREHAGFLSRLVAAALQLANGATPQAAARWRQLQRDASGFETLMTTFLTVADNCGATDTSQLEMCARHWACALFSLTGALCRLAGEALVDGDEAPSSLSATNDVASVEREMKTYTERTILAKEAARDVIAVSGDDDDPMTSDLQLTLDDLDRLMDEMRGCSGLLTHVAAPYETTEKLYAPCSLRLLQWQWQLKVQCLHLLVDDVTAQFEPQLTRLPQNVTSDSAPGMAEECRRGMAAFQDNFRRCKGRLLVLLRTSGAASAATKAQLRRHLEALSVTERELARHVTRPGGADDSLVRDCDFAASKRKWAVKCHAIVAALKGLEGCREEERKEVIDLLTSANDENRSVPVMPRTDTHKVAPLVAPTSVEEKQQAASNRSADLSTLTGSLLDFASDLGDLTVHSTPLATRSTNRAVPVAPPGGESWKAATAGPRTQHTTPDSPGGRRLHHAERPLAAVARITYEADQWEEEGNPIVRVAKEMAEQFDNMAAFPRGEGTIKSRAEMIEVAREIARNGEKLVQFVKVIARYCVDRSFGSELLQRCDKVPMTAAQLHILAGVKSATPDDLTTERMLIKTAANLVDAINQTLTGAQTACLKGLSQPSEQNADDAAAVVLATRWRRCCRRQREREASCGETDELGLRKVASAKPPRSLGDLLMERS